MNRRTLLQGVLAFVGLSRFVQAKPDKVFMSDIGNASDFEYSPPTWQAYQDAEVEIREMCFTFLKRIEEPDLYWHVRVNRAPSQPDCSHAYIGYDILSKPANVDVARLGIHLPTWVNYSQAEKQSFVSRQIGAACVAMGVAWKTEIRGKTLYIFGSDSLRSMA